MHLFFVETIHGEVFSIDKFTIIGTVRKMPSINEFIPILYYNDFEKDFNEFIKGEDCKDHWAYGTKERRMLRYSKIRQLWIEEWE